MWIMLGVVMTLRMPVGLRRHLFSVVVNHSWVAEEGGEVNESAAVTGFHENASSFAGSPAFDKFTEGCKEEGLLAKVSLCFPLHDITSVVMFMFKSFSWVV